MALNQDIEGVSALLFDRLTLQEKALAKELVTFTDYDRTYQIGRYRAPVLQLDDVVTRLAAAAVGEVDLPRNLLIYCDLLVCNDTVTIGSPKPLIMSIFARRIIHVKSTTSNDSTAAIQFKAVKSSSITVWAQELPSPFKIDFVSESGKTESKELTIPDGSPGFNAIYDGSTIVVRPRRIPDVEFSYESWLSSLNEDGSLRETPFLRDNIPRLLQFQILVAASQMYENPDFALQLLNWICAATSTRSGSIINVQARSLRNSLSINSTIPAAGDKAEIRPALSLTMCLRSMSFYILKARLQAASAFEQSFQSFLAQERDSTNWALLGNDLVIKSDNALQEYKFLKKVAATRFQEASDARKIAEKCFEATKIRVDEEAAAFQKNVDEWKSDMKDAGAWNILNGVVEIGAAVAAAVLTFGAAAPAIVAVGAEVVSTVSEVVELWKKVKAVMDGLKDIYEKLKPTLEALGELFGKVAAMAENVNGPTAAAPAQPSQDMKRADMSLDALNALAQWRLFDVQVELLKESLATCGIKDKEKYHLALKALVIDGQTLLQARTSLIARGDELAIVTLRLAQEDRSRPQLENMVRHFQTDKAVVQLLKIAMFDRLLAVRCMVFVDFHSYASAYMFHSLETYVPVTLSPVKPVVDYLNDAATLQSAVSGFGSKVCVQRRIFSIPYGAEEARRMLARLVADGSLELRVSPDDEQFEGMCRVRLSQARFTFAGARVAGGVRDRPLRLALSTGGQFYDICFPSATPTSTLIRGFSGERRRVMFERELGSGRIQCDGDFGLKRDYLMHTPLTTWTVEVTTGSLPATGISDADISGAALDLTCEVCFLS